MNREFRARIVSPATIPIAALIFIAALTWSISRVLLALDKDAAVVIALLIAVEILVGSAIVAVRPRIRTSVLGAVLVLAFGGVVGSGIVANRVVGERPIGEEAEEVAGKPERGVPAPGVGGAGAPTVDVVDNAFEPKEITIAAGASVTWKQTGTQPHTVTADDGSFDSHPGCKSFADAAQCMKQGDTFEFTFEKAGRYPYFCTIHGAAGGQGMAGVVVVKAGAAAPPAPAGGEAAPKPAAERADVQDNVFAPKEITVKAGTEVVWTQTGTQPHTVTADDGSFDSSPDCKSFADAAKCLKQGDTFAFTFDDPGRYPYYCTIHGAAGGQGMAGVVIVE